MKRLFEQYRPATWGEVIGQDKVLVKIDNLRKRGLAGRAWWISGVPGCGKTSIAYLLAAEIAEPWAVEEVAGQQVTAEWLNALEDTWGTLPLGSETKRGRAYVLNEAHRLSTYAVNRLLCLLEDKHLPAHVAVIFTTTTDGLALFEDGQMDASPLLSRCTELRLTNQGLAQAFAVRAKEIATAEGLDGQDVSAYVKLVQSCKNNFRAVLQKIEEGAMV